MPGTASTSTAIVYSSAKKVRRQPRQDRRARERVLLGHAHQRVPVPRPDRTSPDRPRGRHRRDREHHLGRRLAREVAGRRGRSPEGRQLPSATRSTDPYEAQAEDQARDLRTPPGHDLRRHGRRPKDLHVNFKQADITVG